MLPVEPWMVLSLGAIVFSIGLFGLALRRNVLVILMCIELMLNGVNLTFVTFSKMHQNFAGELSVLFVITVAAAEAAVGLGLVIAMFRTLRSVDSGDIQMLRK